MSDKHEAVISILHLIAAGKGKTLISIQGGDYATGYSTGANRAFEQMASLAEEALKLMSVPEPPRAA